MQVAPRFEPITSEYLDYNEVMEKYEQMMRWLAKVYVNALKIIHYMHDKYDYEAFEMSLHDGDVERTRATGIAGLSIVADSIAAMKNCRIRIIRDESGLAVDYKIEEGEYVPFGNNCDETDEIAVSLTETFMEYLRQHRTYRDAIPTQSLLTNHIERCVPDVIQVLHPMVVRRRSVRSGAKPDERTRYQGCCGSSRFCC